MVAVRRFVARDRTRALILGAVVLAALVAAGVAIGLTVVTGQGSAQGPLVPTTPGTVKLSGHTVKFGCAGSGSPTVVFDGQAVFEEPGFATMWPLARQSTRVCVFLPVHLGKPGAPRSSAEQAAQLHTVLHDQRVRPPYVLVGSEGDDLYMYAARFRNDVGGLVFVDPTYPHFAADFLRVLGPRRTGEAPAVTGVRKILSDPTIPIARYRDASDLLVGWTGALDHLPMIVFSRGQPAIDIFGSDMPRPVLTRLDAVWLEGQTRLTRLSSNARHVRAVQSDDPTSMMENQSDLVMFGIQEVMHAVSRPSHTLPACVESFQPAVPSPYNHRSLFNDPSGNGEPALACVPRGHGPTISGVRCEAETLTYHVHAHLSLIVAGRQARIPAGIGVDLKHDCLYWLHTHDTSGLIHMESPHGLPHVTLGNLFDIWGQPLSRSQVWHYQVQPGRTLRVYVGRKLFAGDPRSVPLRRHAAITIEIGPPFPVPPAIDFGSS